jgi:multiple sugar transport system substrate-binding protein/raffinose/stachyose/melibiose transport system substrate-binding protein
MKNINRLTIGVGAIILLVLVAAQCISPQAAVEPTVAIEPVELTYISLFYDEAPLESIEPEIIEQFEADHPHITVSRESRLAFGFVAGSTPQELLTDTSPPDVVALALDHTTPSFVDQGLLVDFSEIWLQPELNETYPVNFRPLGQWDGKQYFLPANYSWVAVYYNKQIFNQYGLQPPETWDEFVAIADTLAANNITPIAMGRWDLVGVTYWLDYLNLRLNGPEFHAGLVRGQEKYDDPRIRDVFEIWTYLVGNDYYPQRFRSMRMLEAINLVHEGKAGMILAGSTEVGSLPQQFQDKLDFFRFPVIDPEVPVGEVAPTFGYVIPVGARHPQEAMEFLAYMVSVEAQTAMVQRSSGQDVGVLPVQSGIDATKLTPKVSQGIELVQDADNVGQPYVYSFAPDGGMGFAAYLAFSKFFRNTDNLDSALDDLEKARQQAFGE